MPAKTRKVKKANPLTGSSLDDFLRDEGILEEVEAALKRVLAVLEDVDDLAVVAKRRSEPTLAHGEVVAAFKQS